MTLPGEHRATGRVLVSNSAGEYLLLLTHFDPEVGLPPRWLTPGGGIDAGETPRQAAARELFEETGLVVEELALGEKIAQFSGRWDWADGLNHHTFTDHIFEYQVEEFVFDRSHWTPEEHRDVLKIKWWTIEELSETGELISPPGLVSFIENR
jgi:8-oxo-dGTP pyrophosphatase MutT (NUDIX family)